MLTENIFYCLTTQYITHDALQVLFSGVSILTLLMDPHMRVSAIRFYLLSLVISGTCCTHFKDHKQNTKLKFIIKKVIELFALRSDIIVKNKFY